MKFYFIPKDSIIEKYKYQLLIIAIGLIGYWQVAFLQFTLKWDMIDQYFPCRYFVSECLRNNIFPFWNPYQHWGYAIHADPQSGVWYPIVWLISFFGGYNIYANQFEFMLHIIVAGTGMFLLINYLVKHQQTAFLISCCYMLSGFFIGNAQHLGYIVSGAWIPFVLFYYSKIYLELNYKNVIRCALCFFMQTTGGYPAFTIIISYSLLIIFIIRIVSDFRKKDFARMKKFITGNFLFLVLSLLLASGLLLSEYLSKDLITRSTKLPLAVALQNPFSPQSLISCLLPLASAKNPEFLDTDISMSNLYFGIFCFAFFIVALFRKKSAFEKTILAAGIFFLLAAFGRYTPVRTLLYDIVPLMNLFRFPSVFRLFALICFLIVAAFTLRDLLNGNLALFKKFRIVLTGLLVIYFILSLIYFLKSSMELPDLFFPSFNESVSGISFNQSIWLQSLFSFVLIGVSCFLFFKKNKFSFGFLSLMVICDLFLAVQLNIPVTAINNVKTANLNKRMNGIPKKFPLPENIPAINYSDSSNHINPLWRNMNTWYKKPAFDGYNNFKMKGYGQLADEPKVLHSLLKNNIAFFSDSYSFYTDTIRETEILNKNPSHLFFSRTKKNKITFQNLRHDTTDTAIFLSFNPKKIVLKTTTLHPQLLSLMQHDFLGWKIFLDGKPVEHFTSDYLFQTIYLPQGNHLIEYRFQRNELLIALIVSIVSMLICLIVLLKNGTIKK